MAFSCSDPNYTKGVCYMRWLREYEEKTWIMKFRLLFNLNRLKKRLQPLRKRGKMPANVLEFKSGEL